MKKVYILGLILLGIVGFGNFSPPVYAINSPTVSTYFTPDTWVAPGAPLQYTVELTNTDITTDLTDAVVTTVINTHSQYTYSLTSSEGGFSCVQSTPSRYSSTTSTCTGGIVPAGQTVSFVYDIETPSTILYRDFSYGAMTTVDPYGMTSIDSVLIAPYYAPNLIVTGNVSPTSTLVGSPLNYTVNVMNMGYKQSPETVLDVVLPDGTTSQEPVPSLPADGKATFTFVFTPTTSGAASAYFEVDSENLIEEGSENDNASTLTASVLDALPDLIVSQAQPGSVAVNSTYTKTVTVANAGTRTATGITLRDRFFISNTVSLVANHGFICSRTTYRVGRSSSRLPNGFECTGGSLAPGESATVTATINAPWYKTTVTNNLSVDTYNTVVESDETNNSTAGSIVIL